MGLDPVRTALAMASQAAASFAMAALKRASIVGRILWRPASTTVSPPTSAVSGNENPCIEPVIAGARRQVRMVGIEHHDVSTRTDRQRADRPLQRLRAGRQHGSE